MLEEQKVYVLRICRADMTSKNGFVWPVSGHVEAPDWSPEAECGNGLHGWLWGLGDYSVGYAKHDAKWLVVEVDADSVVYLTNKVKFPKGDVVKVGTWLECFTLVQDEAVRRGLVTCNSVSADNCSYASDENSFKHASATGMCSRAATKSFRSHASTSSAYGRAFATGEHSHAIAAGESSKASATGLSGKAVTLEYASPASGTGIRGVGCCLGQNGHARAGYSGSIILTYWDGGRNRHVIGYVGENGIKANTWYTLDKNYQLEEAE